MSLESIDNLNGGGSAAKFVVVVVSRGSSGVHTAVFWVTASCRGLV
jgi:hypothetical protein